jgi:hypothetical protein
MSTCHDGVFVRVELHTPLTLQNGNAQTIAVFEVLLDATTVFCAGLSVATAKGSSLSSGGSTGVFNAVTFLIFSRKTGLRARLECDFRPQQEFAVANAVRVHKGA